MRPLNLSSHADSSFHIDQIEDGLTPTLLAVHDGHTKIARLLLENDPKPDIKAKGASDWTVLHYALWGPGQDDMLELLVDHGANFHAPTKEGTPLHFAATHNNVRAARRVMDQNAVLDAEDDTKRTPIMRAALGKKYDMVKLLLGECAYLDTRFDSKLDIKRFLNSIEDARRGSVSSRGSTLKSTSGRFSLSRMRRGSKNHKAADKVLLHFWTKDWTVLWMTRQRRWPPGGRMRGKGMGFRTLHY